MEGGGVEAEGGGSDGEEVVVLVLCCHLCMMGPCSCSCMLVLGCCLFIVHHVCLLFVVI